MRHANRILVAAVATAVAACATTPETLPELEQARARVESLAQNPGATGTASRDLAAARAALARAEQALEEGENREIVAHLAYLADRRAELGLTRIEEAEARRHIATAESERNRILLQARERETRAARQETQAAQLEARTAQQEAQASQQAALQARTELESLQQQFASLQARQTERGMVLTLGDVLFDTDQSTLKPGAETTIDRLAEFLGQNEGMRIRIEGHTDSTGTDQYNEELSRRRAQAVADALSANGVPPNRVEVLGRGEAYPVASNETSAGRQQNRRVEVVFSNQSGTFARTPDAPLPAPQPPPGS